MLRKHCKCFVAMVALCNAVLNAELILADTANELAERARVAANRGDFAEAIQLATQAIKLDPNNASAYKTRGLELFRAAQIGESITISTSTSC